MSKIDTREMPPQIGIWWDDGEQLVVFSHTPTDVEPIEGICDSELEHVDLWPEAAMRLGKTADDEYCCVPQGRVVSLVKSKTARIIHGNATPSYRLKAVAKAFDLRKWEARTDYRYMMGDRADDLFEN